MSQMEQIGVLEQLRKQHAEFSAQRDQVQINFQQLVGAIYACEVLIQKHEQQLKDELMKQVAEDTKEEGLHHEEAC